MTAVRRVLVISLIVFAALLPVAPMLLLALVVLATAAAALAPATFRLPAAFSREQRLALFSVALFRGPPAALALS